MLPLQIGNEHGRHLKVPGAASPPVRVVHCSWSSRAPSHAKKNLLTPCTALPPPNTGRHMKQHSAQNRRNTRTRKHSAENSLAFLLLFVREHSLQTKTSRSLRRQRYSSATLLRSRASPWVQRERGMWFLPYLQLLYGVLIDWVSHVDNFVSFLSKGFKERRIRHGLTGLSGDVVDVFLVFLHAVDILLQRHEVVAALARVEAKELSNLRTKSRQNAREEERDASDAYPQRGEHSPPSLPHEESCRGVYSGREREADEHTLD